MKILLLASPLSTHIVKWANSLDTKGIKVFIYGLSTFNINLYNKNVVIKTNNEKNIATKSSDGSFNKAIYLLYLNKLKKIINQIKPDILHSHYVSSYGFLGALTNYKPHFTSVWGNDIFIFPKKTILHKKVIKYSLNKSDMIFATSKAIANETALYTSKNINIIPFGIDTKLFNSQSDNSDKEFITIGTIKAMEEVYGIDTLIKAFRIVINKLKINNLKLLIVGGGSKFNDYYKLIKELELENYTEMTGYISHSEINNYHKMLDIAVYLSNSEGFGVSVLESSASEKPVVVSNIMALPEIVKDGITGFIVPANSPDDAANAIIKIVNDKELRIRMGKNGREFVKNNYEWDKNVNQMINYYENYLSRRKL